MLTINYFGTDIHILIFLFWPSRHVYSQAFSSQYIDSVTQCTFPYVYQLNDTYTVSSVISLIFGNVLKELRLKMCILHHYMNSDFSSKTFI